MCLAAPAKKAEPKVEVKGQKKRVKKDKDAPKKPMPTISNAVSETIFFGPYRTTFNLPAEITIAFDKEKFT